MNKFFWLFLMSFQLVYSQKTITLLSALEQLTNKHGIEFSYNPDQIDVNKYISITPSINLQVQIKDIQKQAQVIFEKINNNNYIVFINEELLESICIKFVDNNGNPVEKASIWGFQKTLKTDINGIVRCSLKKEFDVRNSYPILVEGYKVVFVPIGNFLENCKTIKLEREIIALKEVTISNYLTKGIFKDKNGGVKVDLANTGILPGVIEPDIIQSLQFIPGVQSPDENIFGLHIRGSTPDQNLVLYDATKVYQDAHFYGLVSAFNPSVINSVTLYRSSTKSKYGGHAGGVISVAVDNSVPKNFATGISSTLTHTGAYLKAPIFKDKLGIILSARRSLTDLIDNITIKNLSEVAFQNTTIGNYLTDEGGRNNKSDNVFKYEDYSAKLIFKPYKSLTFNFGFSSNENDLRFKGLNINENTDDKDILFSKNQLANQSLIFENEKLGTHMLQLSYTTFLKKYSGFNNFNRNTAPRLLEITFGKENFIDEASLKYEFEKRLNKDFTIIAGYDRSRYKSGFTAQNFGPNFSVFEDAFQGEETAQALWSSLELDLKKWRVNLGIRRQFFSRINNAFWEPRLFVNYSPLPKLWLRYGFEKKHQSISRITDLRNDGLGNLFDRLWVISTNQELPILSSKQSSLGLDYQKKGWTLDAEVYIKKLKGIGILLTENIFEPQNVTGNNDVKGIDILIKKRWKNYESWLSYSFLDSDYTFKDINANLPFNGNYDITHSLVWTHTYTLKNFQFSLGSKFRTGIPYSLKQLDLTAPESNFLKIEDFNGRRLPNYYRLDGSILYTTYLDKKKHIKTQLGVAFQNITNKRNILSKDARVIEVNNPIASENSTIPSLEEITRQSLGFTPNIVFKIDFLL